MTATSDLTGNSEKMCDPSSGRDACGILTREGGPSIAYRRVPGAAGAGNLPTVVFLHGLASDMSGTKATALAEHAKAAGFPFIRFDMGGHGKSGGRFTACTVGGWRDDTLAVIDELTEGPLVLVGSSMGGWVALLAAVARPARVRGLMGIAAAPDFTETIRSALTEAQRETLERTGEVEIADDGEALTIGRPLLEEGRHHVILRDPIAYLGAVRLVQGMRDASVPWRTAYTFAEHLQSADVRITLVKDGGHRLSRPRDLALLVATLDDLVAQVAGRTPAAPAV